MADEPRPVAAVRAAGAVLWRPASTREGVEVAVVHRPKYDDWSLAKGKAESGEHVLQTAVREVAEETGQHVSLGRPAGTTRYQVDGRPKVVHYWFAQGHHQPFVPTSEVDELVWVPPSAARGLLTQPRDAQLVRSAVAATVDTQPLVVLRHAKARKRDGWHGRDADRPLEARGRAQSDALVEVLLTLGPMTVVSSDSERALSTVEPLAHRLGVHVEVEPQLSEEAWAQSPETSLARVVELRKRRTPLLLCSHRPLLPALLERLCEGSGVTAPPRPLETAAFVVLQCAQGRVVTAERHERPVVTGAGRSSQYRSFT